MFIVGSPFLTYGLINNCLFIFVCSFQVNIRNQQLNTNICLLMPTEPMHRCVRCACFLCTNNIFGTFPVDILILCVSYSYYFIVISFRGALLMTTQMTCCSKFTWAAKHIPLRSFFPILFWINQFQRIFQRTKTNCSDSLHPFLHIWFLWRCNFSYVEFYCHDVYGLFMLQKKLSQLRMGENDS